MNIADLLKPAKPWAAEETWAERLDACASMLYVHGYIPLSARERINAKLTAQLIDADLAQKSPVPEGNAP